MYEAQSQFAWNTRGIIAKLGETLSNLAWSILWYIKQLLPLTYRTTYIELGIEYFVVWNMWFGVSFNAETHAIGPGVVPGLGAGVLRTDNFPKDMRKFILQQDIIIARGTVFASSPIKTERMPGTFYNTVIGLSDNTSGYLEYECPNSEVKNYFKEM